MPEALGIHSLKRANCAETSGLYLHSVCRLYCIDSPPSKLYPQSTQSSFLSGVDALRGRKQEAEFVRPLGPSSPRTSHCACLR